MNTAWRVSIRRIRHGTLYPGTRLYSLCGAALELDPVLKGFDAGFDS
ncbi:hypothetical protein [Streptomyces sp. NBC_01750]|nr:hypothetical protein [Streptomyces sp. NBC_01750]WSD37488.1 hypothetical protein OG966_39740 [Streptomyces sp. NBC_01750]